MQATRWALTGLLAPLLTVTAPLAAQEPLRFEMELLQAVMPAADRFDAMGGEPPVIRAYATDSVAGSEELIGYLFLTSDLPPEETGYNGPIEVLVGMDLSGTITGARVIDYYESLRRSDGDFLRRRGFQEQFAGKHLADAFRVRRDVDGITGATISVAAMARGIRNAARRVASAYLLEAPQGEPTDETIAELTWPELLDRGLAQRLRFERDGVLRIEILLLRIRDEAMATALVGTAAWERVRQQAGERFASRHAWFVGLDGGLDALFRPQILFLARDTDTLRFGTPDYIALGEPRAGIVDGQLRSHGVLLVDSIVDPAQPFTWIADFATDIGADTARYPGVTRPRIATSPPVAATESDSSAERVADPVVAADSVVPALDSARATSAAPMPDDSLGGLAASSDEQRADAVPIQFADEQDETLLERSLTQTSWPRFAILAALLVLTMVAFLKKKESIRWAALTGTLVLLGFGSVGFLSVSHLTGAIRVGPGLFLEDFTLLLFVTFTVVTTLLWGRVFCGYLCPFGALQDFLDRFVPRPLKREFPPWLHRRALLIKYILLAAVLVPVLAGSTISVFQYVEPFGTVFFLSPSALLWLLAAGVLIASAIVPRFYCRYACPLGASLALMSLLSPFRIRRVEQCDVCKVCEQDCPTGAITGPDIDFKECVRCNICETNLLERVGVCQHDMRVVRERLVQLESRPRGQR